MKLSLLDVFNKLGISNKKEPIKEKIYYCDFCRREAKFFIKIQKERKKFCQKHYNDITKEVINNEDQTILENMYIQKIGVGDE